jgi:HEPN domain-containing protein
MDKPDQMIHSAEFDGIPIAEQYFWLARAYLDGSRVLCESLIDEDFSPQYSSTRVILHLCRHSVELFLKGAIAVASDSAPPQTHNLAKLLSQYKRLYPDPEYWFEVPFGFEALESYDLFPEATDQFHRTLDQRYRYPAASDGQPFNALEGFIAGMFLRDVQALWKSFLILEFRITKGLSNDDEDT